MLTSALRFLVGVWLVMTVLAVGSHASANCDLQSPNKENSEPYKTLEQGLQRIVMQCDISETSVLHFPRSYTSFAQLYTQDMERVNSLVAADVSFVLPAGKKNYVLDVSAQVPRPLSVKVSSLSEYQRTSSIHTFTISLFIGFCFALTIYVGILGNSIRNYGFYSYSFYVLNAAIFFLLQEGLMNIVLPDISVFNSYKLHVFFAGVTVFAAVNFLDQLLDFKVLLRQWVRTIIMGMAYFSLFLAFIQIVFPISQVHVVNRLLSLITLITMVFTFSSCVYACIRKVHCSYLVMSGIAIMVTAMSFRLILIDASPFMYRYGLIIGITLEAFIFALATSKKVRKLDDDRLTAFKRASTDSLCSLLNRSGWEGVTRNLLDTFNKKGGYLMLSFIDIDNFKAINDAYGHAAGDDVLRVVAKVLKSRCRDQDAVGRLGGDEFVVMSHCFSEKQARRLASRIEESLLERDIRLSTVSIPITASVGSYITAEKCESLEVLIEKADALMYVTKSQHKQMYASEA